MVTILPDGAVVPLYQTAISTASAKPRGEDFTQWGLRVGQVREIIYPKDHRSVSKKFNEYRVEVQHRDGMGRTASTMYPNCFLASTFGGQGDKLRFTHRFAPQTNEEGVGKGSKVIIGCIGGSRTQAVILGGLRDTDDAPDEDTGHSLYYEFNGVRSIINKDGEFSLEFQGATDYSGKLLDSADPDASGTFVKMQKNGNFVVANGSAILELLRADQGWNMKGDGDLSIESLKNNITLQAVKGVGIFTSGVGADIRLGTKSHISLEATGGVHIGADATFATEHLVLGDTWAQQMAALCSAMTGALSAAATGLTTASAAIVVVPATAAPGLAAAAAGLTAAISALANFQSQLVRMLSKKNTTD